MKYFLLLRIHLLYNTLILYIICEFTKFFKIRNQRFKLVHVSIFNNPAHSFVVQEKSLFLIEHKTGLTVI